MKRRPLAAVLGLLPLLALAVLWARSRGAPERGASVLLVTIDTLRADRVGAYGGPGGLTPALDSLAGGGLVFEEALASVPLTLPSHATILTGLDPPRHGVHDNGTYVVPGDLETLATLLRARGYATAAFVGAYVLDRRFGLARGFDRYDDRIERGDEGRSVLESERRGDRVVAAAAGWLAERSGPFLAWVHLYDPHAPYDPPAPFRERHAGRPYDGEVAYADACVGRLLQSARSAAARGAASLLVAVVGDHGESLGEHGELTHGFYVYQSTLRVPMLLSGPGVPPGTRRRGPARTADLLPTLLGRLGLEAPPGIDGVDLLARAGRGEAYAESVYPRSFGWAPLRSLRLGSMKLIGGPRPELFDVASDPGETTNLAPSRPETVARLQEALRALRSGERAVAQAPPDRETADRLRALGYVAAAPAAPAEEDEGLPDPKDRVELYRAFEEATWSLARGEVGVATSGLRALVAREPENAVFRTSLSSALRRQGRAFEAVKVLGTPGVRRTDAIAWHELAGAQAEAGRLAEAIASERKASALNPLLPEPHNHLGLLLVRQGRAAEALVCFERSTALDPNNARAWNNRGNALRAVGRAEEAATAYRRAAEIDPADADPLNGLGVLAVTGGRPDEAAALFRRALGLAPSLSEARLNLAVALAQSARTADALRELEPLLRDGVDPMLSAKARGLQRELRASSDPKR